jgi:hypothetical protein
MSWAQGNEEPHKAAVRASVVAQASRRLQEPNGPKASNDRWSEGTQEDGLMLEKMSEKKSSPMAPPKKKGV